MLKHFSFFFTITDPDIVIGHELFSTVLEVLYNRLKARC